MAADGGTVYVVVSRDADVACTDVFAFDARHGAMQWHYRLAQPVAPLRAYAAVTPPRLLVSGGSVYLLAHSGTVVALDARAGSPEWRLDTEIANLSWTLMPGEITMQAASGDASATSFLYVATAKVYAISPADGAVRWQFAPEKPTTPYAQATNTFSPAVSLPALVP